MDVVNMKSFLTFVLLIFLALLDVSVCDPRIFETSSGVGDGSLGSSIFFTAEIHEFNQVVPGKAYTGPSFFPVNSGQVRYAVGIGSSDKQLKLIFDIRDWINGKPTEQLNEMIFDSVDVTVTPNQGAGKKLSFSNVQFTKQNDLIQRLPLLSENELIPYTQGNFMKLQIDILYNKPPKIPKKGDDENKKTPAWKIVVPIVVVLAVAAIAVGFVVRRRMMTR